MKTLKALIIRNTKMFFKDKGLFFSSLITPMILLVLYISFLGNVYRDSLLMSMPEGVVLDEGIVNGFVSGQLISSILAVCCVTVSFCSNMLMVQDRANGTAKDLFVTPTKPHIFALGYYFATLISTMIISLFATGACLIYAAVAGFYMSFGDVMLVLLDTVLLVMFGTALSSVINFFLTSQGQISAVGTIVSSGYGFICGAYMPISQFSDGLQRVIMLLPGTYGTSLIRSHAMRGVFEEMTATGISPDAVKAVADSIDSNIYFFGREVPEGAKWAVLALTVTALVGLYVLLNIMRNRKNKRKCK